MKVRLTTPPKLSRTVAVQSSEGFVLRLAAAFPAHGRVVIDEVVLALGRLVTSRKPRLRALALGALDAIDTAASPRYFDVKDGVLLQAGVALRIAAVARRYFRRAGRRITVTSGTRDPHRQADAMYGKLSYGVDLSRVYGNRGAARDIQRTFREGRRDRKPRAEIVGDMSAVITEQIGAGVYISKHLVAGAVDIRCKDMSRQEKRWLRHAVKADGRIAIVEERRPPHFHLTLR